MPPATVRELLAGLVDYAGLFPPAALPMGEAVARYASYRRLPHAWALGRFVVPAAQLGALADAAIAHRTANEEPWPVSALVGDDLDADAAAIRDAEANHPALRVDTVETRAATAQEIQRRAAALAGERAIYMELPIADEPRDLLIAVQVAGARAKVRMGGVTADAFPAVAHAARILSRCAELQLPFKATAGLHHPLTGEYRLTYADDAPTGTMFGFLNVFLAAAFARAGMDDATLAALLDERDAGTMRFGNDDVRWRAHCLTRADLAAVRTEIAIAFGSCSFREPIDDLLALGLL